MSGTIFAVDGTNQLHRYWHGIRERAADTFLAMLTAIDDTFHPQEIVCAFDNSEPTFRHVLESAYKSGRSEKEYGLLAQLQAGIDGVVTRGLTAISVSGFEADDILATIAEKCSLVGNKLVIVSSDKDCRQLLSPECVMLLSYRKGQHGYTPEWFNEAALKETYGVSPSQWIDWQTLVGDSTDSVIGVPGVGSKTATELLRQAGSLDELFRNPWCAAMSPRQRSNLANFKTRRDIVRQLVSLRRDVPINWEP